ncbi:hypothetical protein BDV23DRAFT_163825 [Aspergillus alliaceus]|uniref:Uncharacterized protein n=1 Tax=Petromyces alliaceus TaxID=209559 RepID=A0A5N7BX17_PETAA|nr:hypothetical protein BDV23DRAFT_163825 [Aspergillus alliaceus]
MSGASWHTQSMIRPAGQALGVLVPGLEFAPWLAYKRDPMLWTYYYLAPQVLSLTL